MKRQLFLAMALLLAGQAVAQNITGRITSGGKGLKGVAVSDGQEVVLTDKHGRYQMQSLKTNGYVFYSLPRGYAPQVERGFMPRFWAPLHTLDVARHEEHNFELARQKGGTDRHVMIVGADVHLSRNHSDLEQFLAFMPALERERQLAKGKPLHTMFLGDTSWDAFWTKKKFGLPQLLDYLEKNRLNTTLWGVMGNHDHDPAVPHSHATDFLAGAAWRTIMGPGYYSFNLGRAHYVVLDDILYLNEDKGGKYNKGVVGARNYEARITPRQFAWLEKDLATVRDKKAPLIIALHIPVWGLDFENLEAKPGLKKGDTEKLCQMLAGFEQVHILSGHTHINRHAHPKAHPNIVEHNLAALSASWWKTGHFAGVHMCMDGSPGGYMRWEVDGRRVRHTYCSTDRGDSLQMRVYDMNAVAHACRTNPGLREVLKNPAYKDYSDTPENTVLVNVFALEKGWRVEVFEDGKPLPTQRVTAPDPILALLCQKNPHLDHTYSTYHLIQAQAATPHLPITVRLTDNFGRRYEQVMQRPKPHSLEAYF